jgi:hypothetical protein
MLEDLLLKNKPSILKKWFDLILDTYPHDTQKFLKSQKNPFTNPVGNTISQGMEHLFEELIHGIDPERTSGFLDQVIRIRAVQGLSPSQAISFMPHLKKVTRDALWKDLRDRGVFEEYLVFESRVDDMSLMAFDIFVQCREKLLEIRANELRNRTKRLLKKTNLFHELEEEEQNAQTNKQ